MQQIDSCRVPTPGGARDTFEELSLHARVESGCSSAGAGFRFLLSFLTYFGFAFD